MRKMIVCAVALFSTVAWITPAEAHPVRRHKMPQQALRSVIIRPQEGWNAVKEHVAACESRGSYTARNRRSTASGKYQIINSTWARRFGVRSAYLATPEQQEQVAVELYAKNGLRPWRSSQRCWQRRIRR